MCHSGRLLYWFIRQNLFCMSSDECRSEMMLILLVCALPQVSLKCRAPEVSQCVFQSYEAMLKNWETPPPRRRPGRCPSQTPGASSCSPSPDPRTILHLHSVREPLPAVSGLEAALCMSFSSVIRMLNDDFCPVLTTWLIVLFLLRLQIFLVPSLSCPSLCLLAHNFQFLDIYLSVNVLNDRVTLSRCSARPCRARPATTFILLETDSRVTYIPVTVSSAWGSLIIS